MGLGIALDLVGNAYVSGRTGSLDFPTMLIAFDTTYNGGFQDAFVTKLNATGSALVYSTYLGGNDSDEGFGIALDVVGNAYVTGRTSSPNFPTTPVAFDMTFNGAGDAFVTKVNPPGTSPVHSSYLGGSGNDQGFAIVIANPNAYVTGVTSSADFPTTTGAFDTTLNGGADAFVTAIADFAPCPPDDDSDNDGLIDAVERLLNTLLNNRDSDGDGIVDGNDDANGNGFSDEDEDDNDECPDADRNGNGIDDEDEDD